MEIQRTIILDDFNIYTLVDSFHLISKVIYITIFDHGSGLFKIKVQSDWQSSDDTLIDDVIANHDPNA